MIKIKTYDELLKEALSAAPAEIDKREGSVFYTAVAGALLKVAQYYADCAHMYDLVFLTTAVGEYLDRKGVELGLGRNGATRAVYAFTYEGTLPIAGSRFFADNKYFAVITDDGALRLRAETYGTQGNTIVAGTPAVPVNTIQGLASAAFGELIDPGVDVESDEDYRQRIRAKIAGPAENGNRQHYKTWCESVAGVGRARIIPLWNGENTVKGVIVSTEGTPAADAVVERVQEYVDPGGTGLGNGVANIGAYFTAVAAGASTIDVSFEAALANGAAVDQAKAEATEALTEYLRETALYTQEDETMTVRVSTIGAMILALPSVLDYADLQVNGGTANIEIGIEDVPVLGEVTVSEII